MKTNKDFLVNLLKEYYHDGQYAFHFLWKVQEIVLNKMKKKYGLKVKMLNTVPFNQTQNSNFIKLSKSYENIIDMTQNRKYPFHGGSNTFVDNNGESIGELAYMTFNGYSIFFWQLNPPFGIKYQMIYIGKPDGRGIDKTDTIKI